MSEEGGPCFGFKKKTVVMTCIALCCLSLVAWTVVMSKDAPTTKQLAEMRKNLANLTNNITINVIDHKCVLNASEPIDKVRMYLLTQQGVQNNITRRNFRKKNATTGKMEHLCKCFCKLNITEEMLVEALNYLQLNATLAPFTTAPTQKRVN